MSLLYKDPKDVKTTCEIKQEDGKIVIDFWADCGKFGTDEMLDGYILTPERLLQILQDRDDYTDDELQHCLQQIKVCILGKVRKNKTRTIQNIADFIIGVLGLIIVFIILISNVLYTLLCGVKL